MSPPNSEEGPDAAIETSRRDNCPDSPAPSVDNDGDGCDDTFEDPDDDNDGVLDPCADGDGSVDSTIERWQATDFYAIADSTFTLKPTGGTTSIVPTSGPYQGETIYTVDYSSDPLPRYLTIDGYVHNSDKAYTGYSVATLPPPDWSGLTETNDEYFDDVHFAGFIDANGNGLFDSGTDQYFRKLGVNHQAQVVIADVGFVPTVSGRFYITFQDGANYPASNVGSISFALECQVLTGDSCPNGISPLTDDKDGDGCNFDEDDDDDGDGIADIDDACPNGQTNWTSSLENDQDGDGCKDGEELAGSGTPYPDSQGVPIDNDKPHTYACNGLPLSTAPLSLVLLVLGLALLTRRQRH